MCQTKGYTSRMSAFSAVAAAPPLHTHQTTPSGPDRSVTKKPHCQQAASSSRCGRLFEGTRQTGASCNRSRGEIVVAEGVFRSLLSCAMRRLFTWRTERRACLCKHIGTTRRNKHQTFEPNDSPLSSPASVLSTL
ncbi:hypothetical protein BU23DRAFT_333397 [Bimuria novae-zelandiae CBS 107.79]|uniref:Uncharacterized protein n=1 Tax=Bimuria novae-zelandiae CBS 107.79 TaxID=1447943 RepID=A0A6A5UT61_9PLEO|nr:hypothetical protein BU23DRAFT_333397 [Bimuria novae-zelandiae CBS 107.79]